MSIQYRDGSFSENMPFEEAMAEFEKAVLHEEVMALFVGTEKELDYIKKKKQLEEQVADLFGRIKKLEQQPIKSSSVIIPTRDEMIRALR